MIERVIFINIMLGSYQLLVLVKLILFEVLELSKFPCFLFIHLSIKHIKMVSSCTNKQSTISTILDHRSYRTIDTYRTIE